MSKKVLEIFGKVTKLHNENPSLPIFFAVNCEDLSDEYGFMVHNSLSVEIGTFLQTDDLFYTSEDLILNYFIDQVCDDYPDFSDARIEGLAQLRYDEQVKKAIIVYTSIN